MSDDDLGTPVPDFDSMLDDIFGDENLFDGVDYDKLPDDPFALPENTYRWQVTDIVLKPTEKNKSKFGFIIKYVIVEGSYSRRVTSEWLHYPNKSDGSTPDEVIRSKSILKNRFNAFGISPADQAQINHRNYRDYIMGCQFYGTTRNETDKKTHQVNVRFKKVVPVTGGSGSSDFDPFGGNSDNGVPPGF